MNQSEMALVTGGAGLHRLAPGRGAAGRGPARPRAGQPGHRPPRPTWRTCEGRFEWIEGDAADFATCRRAAEGVDYVFHQAAIPSVPRSVREPLPSHESGPTATLNMLEAARQAGVRRFLFAASSSAYGDTAELPKHEGMLPLPLSPYAAGKLAGEYYVRVYAQTMGLDGVSLRYFNIFGPRQDPSSPYSGVISLFIKGMSQGRRPTIFGDGEQTRDFTYVANAVAANLAAMRHPEPLARRGLQCRDRAADPAARPGGRPEPDLRHGSRARLPAAAARRRPRLAGQPRADRPRARLSPARPLRRGAEAHGPGEPVAHAPTGARPRFSSGLNIKILTY